MPSFRFELDRPSIAQPPRVACTDISANAPALANLLSAPEGYAAYAGIGSRQTPKDVLDDMTRIASALERRGFTLRSGFAAGADTAFELGTTKDALREIFAPWTGFGANPHSKWDQPRWAQIRAHEASSGRRFQPAAPILLTGTTQSLAANIAAKYHPSWARLSDAARKLHSRNIAQLLGPRLQHPARFVICWTPDGGASGGTGQAIRAAQDHAIPVLNLYDTALRQAVLHALSIEATPTVPSEPAEHPERPSTAGVTYCVGDITRDPADLLVNTVNCVGVMGAGVALAFKTRWPSVMAPYKAACASKQLQPGQCMLFDLPDGRLWAGLATKDHWRNPSRMDWIRTGLNQLAALAAQRGVRRIAIPAPGCGLGGLSWADVRPLVLDSLKDFELHIYAPARP